MLGSQKLTMDMANRAVAEGGDSGELGTGADAGVCAPTRPFLASSNSDKTCEHIFPRSQQRLHASVLSGMTAARLWVLDCPTGCLRL